MKRINLLKNIVLLAILSISLFSCTKQSSWSVLSPDGHIEIQLQISEASNLQYLVNYNKESGSVSVIEPSPLGLQLEGADFSGDLSFHSIVSEEEINESYDMVSGKQKTFKNHCKQTKYCFTNAAGQKLFVLARAYNDGVAFCYQLGLEEGKEYTIKKELTGFKLPAGGKVWMSTYEKAQPWGAPGYETPYTLGTPVGENASHEPGWSYPGLFNLNNIWVLAAEADNDGIFGGSHIDSLVENNTYKLTLAEEDERYGEGSIYPVLTSEVLMPWRYFIISDKLSDVVESGMAYNLAPACKIDDTSWIKTGIASWEWWSSTGGRTVKDLKQYIDLAVEMNWEYTLIDAGWENMPDGTIEEVIEYANQKEIGTLLWYNSGGRKQGDFDRKVFKMADPVERKKEFERIHNLGVKGIKVDFFAGDKPFIIQLYKDILEDAAAYQIVVNFHGCTMPKGWARTYPNLLAMEAIRGAECYRFSADFPEESPAHNALAALLRNTVGAMDYTPTTFSNQKYPHITTWAHELALSTLFESGIVHMADKAEYYLDLPEGPKDFLKGLPARWDETKLIDAVPGEYTVMARRNGDAWFVSGVNGTRMEKKFNFDPASIGISSGTYKIISDGEEMDEFTVEEGDAISAKEIAMAPNGGFVIEINRIKNK